MRTAITLIAVLFIPVVSHSATYYVPDDFPAGIQAAISDASVVNGDTIIVRAGTYWEKIDFVGKAITVKSEMGSGATTINGNKSGSVVTFQSGEGLASVLEGFTITNGYAGYGGGIFCGHSSPTISFSIITGNTATNFGGGMENYNNSSPNISHCTFTGNSADYGGGMYNRDNSTPTVTKCTFTGNTAADEGGGMHNHNSSPNVIECTFKENWAYYAGGMSNLFGSSPTIINCTFIENSADFYAGMENDSNSHATVTDCTFIGNSATWYGGAMSNCSSNPVVTKCSFMGNSTFRGGGMYNYGDCAPTVTQCTFNGNSARNGCGGGMHNRDNSNPTVTNCTFSKNMASAGGGMWNYIHSNPIVTNCTFSGNSVTGDGGGMVNYENCSPTLTNCIFNENSANCGCGMTNIQNSTPTVTNCTFTKNSATFGGGGMYNILDSDSTVTNCIFWNDTPDEIGNTSSIPKITYCCVQGGYQGTGNIDQDPLFMDPGNDDFHLAQSSPCIDVGDNIAPSISLYDFEEDPRIIDGDKDTVPIVDMGCDEFLPLAYVPDEYSTIQDAINALSAGIVIVRPGTYVENIDFLGKDIKVTSELGPDFTIIDGSQKGSVVIFQGGEGLYSALEGFTITNGSAPYGGGIFCDHSSPTISNNIIAWNTASNYGGGMQNYNNSNPKVNGCIFHNNSGTDYGGGMHNYNSSPTVTNCTFTGNMANLQGGGMQNITSNPVVTNCIFYGNSADGGGGIFNHTSNSTVSNCTFTENSASYGGGMGNYNTSSSTLTNCIFWNDTTDEIYDDGTGILTVTYSDVEGGTGEPWFDPYTCLDSDPCFMDPVYGDFHLLNISPCIDAGDNNAPSIPETDFEGDPRIFFGNGTGLHSVGSSPHGAIVDMGADEYCLLKRQKIIPK